MITDRNKAVAREVFDIWSSGELDRLDALVAADVVHHDPYDPHAAEGLAGMRATIAANRERFGEMRLTVHDQIAEGDRVATRWSCTMSHDGTAVSTAGITIDRFEDGKIVEAWRTMDVLGLANQLATRGDGP